MKRVITHKTANQSSKVYLVNGSRKHHIQDWEAFQLGVKLGLWNAGIEDVPIDENIREGEAFTIRYAFTFQANPLDKMVCTQKFGERPGFYKQFKMSGHNGVDFRTKFDDSPDGKRPVYAVMDGVISNAVFDEKISGYGRYIRIDHDGGAQTLYAHLDSIDVVKGQHMRAGDRIGISDNTGSATSAAHLHFGFRPKKSEFEYGNGFMGYIDCLDFFPGDIIFA